MRIESESRKTFKIRSCGIFFAQNSKKGYNRSENIIRIIIDGGEEDLGYEELLNIFEKEEGIPEGITWKDIQNDYLKFMESDASENEKDALGDYGEMLEMFVDIEQQ